MNFLRSNLRGGYYKPYLFKSLVLGVKGRLGHISGGDVTQSEDSFSGDEIYGLTQTALGLVIQGREPQLAVTTSTLALLKSCRIWV